MTLAEPREARKTQRTPSRRRSVLGGVCALLIASATAAPAAASSLTETVNSDVAKVADTVTETSVPSPPVVSPSPAATPAGPPLAASQPPPAPPESSASPSRPPAPELSHAPAIATPGTDLPSAQAQVPGGEDSNPASVVDSIRSPTTPSTPSQVEGKREPRHRSDWATTRHRIFRSVVAPVERWVARVWPAVVVLVAGHRGEVAAREGDRAWGMAHSLPVPMAPTGVHGDSRAPGEFPSSEGSTRSAPGSPAVSPLPEHAIPILIIALGAWVIAFVGGVSAWELKRARTDRPWR
jgi:hypothetical protein